MVCTKLRRCVWVLAALVGPLGCAGVVEDPSGADGTGGPSGDATRADPEDPDFEPVEPLVRRLTKDEYVHTIEDVIGVELPADQVRKLPTDRPLEGFVNIASGQATLPDHVLAYASVAEHIVATDAWDAFVAEHAGCSDTDADCADDLVGGIGFRLFRGPLEPTVHEAFTALFAEVAAEGVGFVEAAAAVGQAMLQSPQFLYLLEVERLADFSGLREVGGYEMASRLSYYLWASAPDDALYEAAADGTLDTPDGIITEVDRMLEDSEKVRRTLGRFVVDWAGLESLPDEDGLRGELVDSAVAFYERELEAGTPLFELLTLRRAYLTPTLAENWGLDPKGDGIEVYDLDAVDGRIGLLTQPGVLAGMTNADGGAIVARGLFLQRQLFCGEPPDPPASLQEDIDEFVASLPEDASDREVAETRLERTECASCHAHFDPLAYGFEHFDFRGRYRMEDEHGNALRADGWIPELHAAGERIEYEGIEDYVAALADIPKVRRCLTQRQLEYALGSRLESTHRHSVEDVAAELDDGDLSALVRAVVTHDLFRTALTE